MSALLSSITTGFPEERTGDGTGRGPRKWLGRWVVGGPSQHMGPRGWKESGPREGEGTQRKEPGRERERALTEGGRVNRP